MTAVVSKGLAGLVWTAPGANSSVAGCTNPYWVSVNTLLRAIGQLSSSTSTQEQYFDVASAIACGAVADTVVPQLFGSGTETQFRFNGTVDDRRAVRDWIQQILNCGLGNFVWDFGRMKFIIRDNASSVSAYTAGNMLYKSLTVDPFTPKFEKLTVQFKDRDYLFATNTVDYTDQDYAALRGRVQNPNASQISMEGCTTKSQAGRYATVRTREELGGVGQVEQDAARDASWMSSIIALDTGAGMVVSVTDPDIPGLKGICNVSGTTATWVSGNPWTYQNTGNGNTELIGKEITIGAATIVITGVASNGATLSISPAQPTANGLAFAVVTMCFRVQRIQINKDYSVALQGRTVTRSMYDVTVGPKPADVMPAPVPVEPARDWGPPPPPAFAVQQSAVDPTQLEISGLAFADSFNTHSVVSAAFACYYVDPDASPDFLSSALLSTDASMHLASAADIDAGDLVLVGQEILLCGAPSGTTVPITRAQLGSTAAAASNGSSVKKVQLKGATASFGADYFNLDPTSPFWKLDVSIAGMTIVAVLGYVVNAYGQGDSTPVCVTGNSNDGIPLLPSTMQVIDVINTDTTLANFDQIVNVAATTRNVTITLPAEVAGRDITVKLSPGSTFNCDVVRAGSDTIDGASSYLLSNPGQSVRLVGA
jgi:hypothetical protein